MKRVEVAFKCYRSLHCCLLWQFMWPITRRKYKIKYNHFN